MALFPFKNPITEATILHSERLPERSNLFKSHWSNQWLTDFSYSIADAKAVQVSGASTAIGRRDVLVPAAICGHTSRVGGRRRTMGSWRCTPLTPAQSENAQPPPAPLPLGGCPRLILGLRAATEKCGSAVHARYWTRIARRGDDTGRGRGLQNEGRLEHALRALDFGPSG
jgi:hypothetical protein